MPYSEPYREDLRRCYQTARLLNSSDYQHQPAIGQLVSEAYRTLSSLRLLPDLSLTETEQYNTGLQELQQLQQALDTRPATAGPAFWQPLHERLLHLLRRLSQRGR